MENWRGAVAMIERAATARGRAFAGCFSIEGIRLHERALRAGVPLQTAVIADTFSRAPDQRTRQLLADLAASDCALHIVPDEVVARLTNGRSLGAILGLVKMPRPPALGSLLDAATAPMLLVLVNVVDPGNVGALVRTAHAGGCTAVIPLGASDPFHPKAVRTSMGSLFKLPVVPYATVDALLTDLRAWQIETVGTAVDSGTMLPDTPFSPAGTALFMGNEYWGLPPEVTAVLDKTVTIPMVPGIDSYSVNAATAIILYEIQRHFRQNR